MWIPMFLGKLQFGTSNTVVTISTSISIILCHWQCHYHHDRSCQRLLHSVFAEFGREYQIIGEYELVCSRPPNEHIGTVNGHIELQQTSGQQSDLHKTQSFPY
eukprot:m.137390 g.137390  ORF g.137390 m.137390 type:complete len:103 (-) comp11646_c0_seq1:1089-1397(-)